MNWIQKINAVWQKVGVVQRALLIAIVMACILSAGLLTRWASTADMRLLYRGLSPEEAGQIVDKISEQGIEYELRGDGTSIYVPENQVYRLRLSMAKEGLPSGSKTGYDIFDKEKIGVSPLVQQLNKTRAMQDELAKTIMLIEGVTSARVHIVRPENTGILATDENETTASVMLVLRPGWTLNQSSLSAITHMVASATDSLKPENVTVADSHGLLTSKSTDNTLIGDASSYKEYKSSIEQSMDTKIENALEMFLGPGRAKVISNVVLDMENETIVTTQYEKGVPEEEVIDSSNITKDPALDSEGQPTTSGTTDKTETITNKYKVPEIVTTKSDVPGKIVSWSISVIVDLYKPKVEAAEEETAEDTAAGAAAAAPATASAAGGMAGEELIMTVEDVKEIVLNAIGGEKMLIDPKSLTVKNIPAFRPAILSSPQESGFMDNMPQIIEIVRQSSMGILAVCALLVLRIFTKASKKAITSSGEGAPGGQLDILGTGLLPPGNASSPAEAFRGHISNQLRENPEQVKQLFNSWLAEES